MSDRFGLPGVQTDGNGAPEASRAFVTEDVGPTLGDSDGGGDVGEGCAKVTFAGSQQP